MGLVLTESCIRTIVVRARSRDSLASSRMLKKAAKEAAYETGRSHAMLFSYLLKPLQQRWFQQKTDFFNCAIFLEPAVSDRNSLQIDGSHHLTLLLHEEIGYTH